MAESSHKNNESLPAISRGVSKTISSTIETQKFSAERNIFNEKSLVMIDKDSDLVNK